MIQLIKGDCLVEMKNISDASVDMILCDLPYGVTKNKWDIIIPFKDLWIQYNRIIKRNSAIILHSKQPFTSKLIVSNLDYFRYSWIWSKSQVSGFLNAKKQPLIEHEDICVFYKNKCTYNPQMIKGKMQLKSTGTGSRNYNKFKAKPKYSDEYYPKTILNFPLQRFKNGHPNQKPVAIMEYLIKTYTNEGELVLDNCMGSGTTGIACVNLNRNFIGIELEENYFNMAQSKINKAMFNHVD